MGVRLGSRSRERSPSEEEERSRSARSGRGGACLKPRARLVPAAEVRDSSEAPSADGSDDREASPSHWAPGGEEAPEPGRVRRKVRRRRKREEGDERREARKSSRHGDPPAPPPPPTSLKVKVRRLVRRKRTREPAAPEGEAGPEEAAGAASVTLETLTQKFERLSGNRQNGGFLQRRKKRRRLPRTAGEGAEEAAASTAPGDEDEDAADTGGQNEALSTADAYRELIRGVYQRHNPSKLNDLVGLLEKYAGAEADVYEHVCQKYGETPQDPSSVVAPAPGVADPEELRRLIRGVYERNNPSKLGELEELLQKYAGAEMEVYEQACKKYGEEPEAVLGEGGVRGNARKKAGATEQRRGAHGSKKSSRKNRCSSALDFLKDEVEARTRRRGAASANGQGWPFLDEEFSANSSDSSDFEEPAAVAAIAPGPAWEAWRFAPQPSVDLYSDLSAPPPRPSDASGAPPAPSAAPKAARGVAPPPPPPPVPPRPGGSQGGAVSLEHFLGEWRDSMGNDVTVRWAARESVRGQLDVVLARRGGNTVKLSVKQTGPDQFECGHYEADASRSSAERVVWLDYRTKGQKCVWERRDPRPDDRGGFRR